MELTLFTPTYNRAYILPELYKSLCEQTDKDFEWIIVDDGSTDGTGDLVEKWKESGLNIRYLYKQNGGMSRAINDGVRMSTGKYFFILCSDDRLIPTAVEVIKSHLDEIENDEGFAAVGFAKGYMNGEYIKGVPPKVGENGYVDASNLERKYYDLDADMCEAYKTELFRRFPMPEWEGEGFAPEQICLNEIALAGYKIRWYPDVIYLCDYLEDGLTKGGDRLVAKNPMGYAMMWNHMLKYPTLTAKQKFRAAANHIALSIVGKTPSYIFKSNRLRYTIPALPLGLVLAIRRKRQHKKLLSQ